MTRLFRVILVVCVALAGPVQAQPGANDMFANMVDEAWFAWLSGDVERMRGALAPDVAFSTPEMSQPVTGAAAAEAALQALGRRWRGAVFAIDRSRRGPGRFLIANDPTSNRWILSAPATLTRRGRPPVRMTLFMVWQANRHDDWRVIRSYLTVADSRCAEQRRC